MFNLSLLVNSSLLVFVGGFGGVSACCGCVCSSACVRLSAFDGVFVYLSSLVFMFFVQVVRNGT